MRKLLCIIAAALSLSPALSAQEEPGTQRPDIYSNEYLDTVNVKRIRKLNDYSMIGVNYGVSFSQMNYNPSRHGRSWRFSPQYVSVMYTHYEKMFGYIPYFAFQGGIAYGHEGFVWKDLYDSGTVPDVDGATECDIRVIEMPVMAQMHFDAAFMKLMANVGCYGGWRMSIKRSGPELPQNYAEAFRKYENRFEYGLQFGAGVGFIFSPFELHFNVLARYSFSSLYSETSGPNPYYLRTATPFDIIATAGLHFHLSKRSGKSGAQLRKEARTLVENNYDHEPVQSRFQDREDR